MYLPTDIYIMDTILVIGCKKRANNTEKQLLFIKKAIII